MWTGELTADERRHLESLAQCLISADARLLGGAIRKAVFEATRATNLQKSLDELTEKLRQQEKGTTE